MTVTSFMDLLLQIYMYGGFITCILMCVISRPVSFREFIMVVVLGATWPIVVTVALNSTFRQFFAEMDEMYEEKKKQAKK